jgi:hypothetical protein
MIVVAAAMLLAGEASAAGAGKRYEVRFPAAFVATAEDLAIDHVSVVIACGEIVAIERVPSDWNIGVSRPISAQVGFDASAGHGASALPNLSELDGVIVVNDLDTSCFAVTHATASSMRGEWGREIRNVRLVERPASK